MFFVIKCIFEWDIISDKFYCMKLCMLNLLLKLFFFCLLIGIDFEDFLRNVFVMFDKDGKGKILEE